MEIIDYLPDYPSIKSSDFVQKLSAKKEFYELRDNQPRVSDKYFNIQLLIRRFLSNITPYDRLFLFMEVGTGKTCASVAAAEGFYLNLSKEDGISGINYPPPQIKNRILIILKNEILEKQFRREIVEVCEQNKYLDLTDENYMSKGDKDKLAQITRILNKNFELVTMKAFAGTIEKMSDKEIFKNYSHRVIIFDEAHLIREGEKGDEVKLFHQYKRFFGLIKPYKTIFSTATPAIDSVEEFVPLFNIFLPPNEQLPTDIDVTSNEFNDIFRVRLRGRIIYIREQLPNVKKIYPGSKLYGTKYTMIYPSVMEGLQREIYIDFTDKLLEGEESESWGKKRIAISNGVFPDGSYDNKGFEKYINKKKTSFGDFELVSFNFKQEYKMYMKEHMRQLSCKVADVVNIIMDPSNKDIKFFIFSPSVTGTGLIYFTMFLNLFGFSSFKSNILPKNEALRYILATSETSTPKDISHLTKVYNDPKNSKSKYIKLFIGSEIISTGTNLLHTRGFIALDTFWNDPRYAQALGRILRQTAYDIFTPEERFIKIYNMASVLDKDYDSKDLIPVNIKQYQDSEQKLIKIKPKERIAKEESIGCILLKERNNPVYLEDYSKECDLNICEYECGDGSEIPSINYNSYNLFFGKDESEQIFLKIKALFKMTTSITLEELFKLLKSQNHNENLIYFTIDRLLNKQILLTNKLGEPVYMYLVNDILMTSSNTNIDDPSVQLYLKNTYINKTLTISELVNESIQDDRMNEIKSLVQKIVEDIRNNNKQELAKDNTEIDNLTARQKVAIFEAVYDAPNNTDGYILSKYLTEFFNKNIGIINNTIYHDIYRLTKESTSYRAVKRSLRDDEPIRIYIGNGQWRNATQEEGEEILEFQSQKLAGVKESFDKYEYYGFLGSDKVFRIVDNIKNKNIKKVKQTEYTGQACNTWHKIKLVNIIVKYNIPHPKYTMDKMKPDRIRELFQDIVEQQGIQQDFDNYTNTQLEEFRNIFHNNTRPSLCKLIYDYFENNNMMLS